MSAWIYVWLSSSVSELPTFLGDEAVGIPLDGVIWFVS